jgi:hypothetical protein
LVLRRRRRVNLHRSRRIHKRQPRCSGLLVGTTKRRRYQNDVTYV